TVEVIEFQFEVQEEGPTVVLIIEIVIPSVVPVLKVLPKSRQPRPTVTEEFDAYYDESAEEPLESIAFGSKKEERETELEVLLQKLIAECEAATKKEAEEKNNDLSNDRIKVARIGGAEETYPEETKEEKREKYEENVPARIRKIVGETEDEDDDNEADEDEEDNDDDDEKIVDEENDEKKEDVEELTKKKDGNLKEQFDPGGFDQSGIIVEKDLEKANEKWKKKVRVFLGKNKGDFDENKREEFVPPRVPTFNAALKEKEGTRLKRLRNSQCMSRNLTKKLALYLPQWNKTQGVTKKTKVMKRKSQEPNHRSRSKGRKRDKKIRSLIMLDEIVNNITRSEPIEITPMPPPYNDSHDLPNWE
ncbi:14414_t:CDS:2, partial [Racocetra persica]